MVVKAHEGLSGRGRGSKVTRTALQNAASITGLMLTTAAMVSDIPEPKQAARTEVTAAEWATCTERCATCRQGGKERPPCTDGLSRCA